LSPISMNNEASGSSRAVEVQAPRMIVRCMMTTHFFQIIGEIVCISKAVLSRLVLMCLM
jgi:hypothetical protein